MTKWEILHLFYGKFWTHYLNLGLFIFNIKK
jgi:hypothetical protein